MAGGLGFLLGAGVGAAAGEIRQKRQEQHKHDDALFDFYSKNPQLVADSPEAQKFVTKYGGKEASQAFIGMAQHTKAAAQQFGQSVMGQVAPTAGGSPAASGQPQPPPVTAQSLRDQVTKGRAFIAEHGQYLSPSQLKAGEAHLSDLEKQASELDTENRQDKREAASGERQEKSIEASGERQDKALAAMSAREDKSLAAIAERQDKTLAKSTAKETDPEAQAKKGQEFIATARKNWENNHPADWFARSETRAKAFGQFMKDKGFDPDTGMPLTEAARPAGVGSDWTHGTVKGRAAWISPDKKSAVFL